MSRIIKAKNKDYLIKSSVDSKEAIKGADIPIRLSLVDKIYDFTTNNPKDSLDKIDIYLILSEMFSDNLDEILDLHIDFYKKNS
jgi:hypothetical protein